MPNFDEYQANRDFSDENPAPLRPDVPPIVRTAPPTLIRHSMTGGVWLQAIDSRNSSPEVRLTVVRDRDVMVVSLSPEDFAEQLAALEQVKADIEAMQARAEVIRKNNAAYEEARAAGRVSKRAMSRRNGANLISSSKKA